MLTNEEPKRARNFECDVCLFKCSKLGNFKRHLSTQKHKMLTNTDKKEPKRATTFDCECGKSYKHRQSLHVHKKTCSLNKSVLVETTNEVNDSLEKKELSSIMTVDNKIDANLLLDLIKQNTELQKQLMTTNRTINNTINNNQKFNINVFLNEQCKNAINFSDFIENIQLSHEDLENNAQLGFVNGISKIISDNLNQLTLYERPLHCTDKKRETLYIRDEDAWNKEKEKVKKKIFEGIQEVSRKGMQELMEWKRSNADYENLDSDFSKMCLVMQKEMLAGENRDKYYKKVFNNIQEQTQLRDVCV